MLRWLLLLGFFAALVVSGRTAQDAYACHPDRLSETRVNLDGDRAKEEVIAADSHDCAHTTFRAYVHVRDRCRGAWRTHDLESEAQFLQQFRIANADGRTKRPEVFFVTTRRLGPVLRGIAKVVRLDDRPSGCARVRTLFRYVPAAGIQTFDVQLKNVAPQFPGLEVVVTESREVAQLTTTYRYDRRRDRYVVYG